MLLCTVRRWKKPDGRLKHQQLIPDRAPPQEVEAGGEEDDGTKANAKRSRRETIKGALFDDYCWQTHQFISHLRRVHPGNPSILSTIPGKPEKVSVKAADPLAKPPVPLYYMHSKTAMYNDNFLYCWDNVFAPAFAIIGPWFTVTKEDDLNRLFELEFER